MANRTVRPSAANRRMSSQNARRLSTSIATVGSSRNTRSGSPAIANANRTRCASPPDRVSARRFTRSVRPARSRIAARGDGLGYRPRARSTSSPTRAPGGRPADWSIAPTRPERTASRGSRPSVRARPEDGSSRPSMMPMAVVLPAPLGPSRATVSPLAMPSATSSRARVSPNRRLTPSNATAVAPAGAAWWRRWVVVVVAVMRRSSAAAASTRSHPRPDRDMTRVTPGTAMGAAT